MCYLPGGPPTANPGPIVKSVRVLDGLNELLAVQTYRLEKYYEHYGLELWHFDAGGRVFP